MTGFVIGTLAGMVLGSTATMLVMALISVADRGHNEKK